MRILILVGGVLLASSVLADDRRDIPQTVYDAISAKITRQTTFVQLKDDGLVRWSPRSIDIVKFVKAPSPTYEDTFLYAIIYKVSVTSDLLEIDAHGTTCQAVVVVKIGEWTDPTVVCEPVDLSRPDNPA